MKCGSRRKIPDKSCFSDSDRISCSLGFRARKEAIKSFSSLVSTSGLILSFIDKAMRKESIFSKSAHDKYKVAA